jgi:peptidoglycan/LPS O-acetylase OafA/YrhL
MGVSPPSPAPGRYTPPGANAGPGRHPEPPVFGAPVHPGSMGPMQQGQGQHGPVYPPGQGQGGPPQAGHYPQAGPYPPQAGPYPPQAGQYAPPGAYQQAHPGQGQFAQPGAPQPNGAGPAAAPAAAPKKSSGGRDRYMDTLRAVAIVRVVCYHAFSFGWMTYLPAMGVMFGLGGSLMARSLDRGAVKTVRGRLRRLLPVLWFFGAITIPIMFWHGWHTGNTAETKSLLSWQMFGWIVPLVDPPGSEWGEIFWGALWYLKTYVWFVLLSPFLLPAFRKVPYLILPLPLLIVWAVELGYVPANGPWGGALVDTTTFMAAWLAGFAHHDGMLKRLKWPYLLALAGFVIGLALYWTYSEHANGDSDSLALDATNTGLGLYSLGVMLILLKFSPKLEWLGRARPLDRLVSVLNSRAVTIYLWHNFAIFIAVAVVATHFHLEYWWAWFPATIALVVVAVFIFGWVEDIAAKRKPELLPGKPKPKPKPEPAGTDAPAPTSPPVGWQQPVQMPVPAGAPGQAQGYAQYPPAQYEPDRGYQPQAQPPAPERQPQPRAGTVYGRPAADAPPARPAASPAGTVYGSPRAQAPGPQDGWQPGPQQHPDGRYEPQDVRRNNQRPDR